MFLIFFCLLSREGNFGLHSTPSNYSGFYGIPLNLKPRLLFLTLLISPPRQPKPNYWLECYVSKTDNRYCRITARLVSSVIFSVARYACRRPSSPVLYKIHVGSTPLALNIILLPIRLQTNRRVTGCDFTWTLFTSLPDAQDIASDPTDSAVHTIAN